MKKIKYDVNTKLSIVEYVTVVNEIVLEYFSPTGEYQPHIGILNAMRVFYNICIKSGKFDGVIPHTVIDIMDIEKIVGDEDFIELFNNAIARSNVDMDFSSAFADAMDIVSNKKSHVNNIIDTVEKLVDKVINSLNPVLANGNIDKVAMVARDVKDGKIDIENVIKAYNQYTANKVEKNNVVEFPKKD